MSRLKVEVIEIAGFRGCLESLRIPFKLEHRSIANSKMDKDGSVLNSTSVTMICQEDLKLLQRLILAGDEHAKCVRSIQVWFEIDAPLWFWQELCTYEVGVTKLPSESTMHCECKGMSGEELMAYKDAIPSGHIQKRFYMMSYQALRNVYFQRRHHRLPIWKEFCAVIENLPYAKELITLEK